VTATTRLVLALVVCLIIVGGGLFAATLGLTGAYGVGLLAGWFLRELGDWEVSAE